MQTPETGTADEVLSCCPTLAAAPLTVEAATELAGLLKALSDAARLRLYSMIASHPNGEVCVCEITAPLGLSQPTISHHLKVLHEAGMLDRSKRGVWVYYAVRRDALADLADLLGGTTR